ncbi:hypothetical protein TNCV_1437171 [Trichonephila clavipes]|nr:hypothetical protein TNCV_1437171 [Trichonephila clavipes]
MANLPSDPRTLMDETGPPLQVEVKYLVTKLKKKRECERSTTFQKIPEGFVLANMVANDAKMIAKVAKNDANLALPLRFRQVLIESPL